MKTINRELSWLSFNERVLQEAMDDRVPLIERLRFLGIYSNNLDEFYRVRVAYVRRLIELKEKKIFGFNGNAESLYKEIRKTVLNQQEKFETTYKHLIALLNAERIIQVDEKNATPEQCLIIDKYFHETFKHTLFPIILDKKAVFPELRDHAIYLAIKMSRKGVENKYALLQIPSQNDRFFTFNDQKNEAFILADDVIRLHLQDIFSIFHYDKIQAFTFKFTRDAGLDIDDDIAISYSEKIERSLKKRKKGVPVRFVHDEDMPEDLLEYLLKCLNLKIKLNTHPGGRYHNFKDFLQFPDFKRADLLYKKQPAHLHSVLEQSKSILPQIIENDVLLHFPYQKFDYVIDVLREAAIDPAVSEIKINIYRVASNSQIMRALIAALYNRKKVTVIMELQARFDEENNLYWGDRLKEHGAKVIYGIPGLKVHSKLLYIKKTVDKIDQSICYVGTGNFNEKTARIYTDFALLTARKSIVLEVSKIFRLFDNNLERGRYNTLLVSPINFRGRLIGLIDKEIKNKREGKTAFIKIKINNLTDKAVIEKLMEAGRVGVTIEMIVRGICCLKTDSNSASHITIISIVDRYLEHARMMVFCNDNKPKYFIGSADLMERNIDQRIEVGVPIYDKNIQQELDLIFNYQWRGSVKSRLLTSDLSNTYRRFNETPFHAQQELWNRYEGN